MKTTTCRFKNLNMYNWFFNVKNRRPTMEKKDFAKLVTTFDEKFFMEVERLLAEENKK